MVVINVKLADGRTVAIVPGAVAAFEEGPRTLPVGEWDPDPVPRVRLVDGTVYECARMQCPDDMPQSVAMSQAFLAAVQQIGSRHEIRQRLVGAS